MEDKDME